DPCNGVIAATRSLRNDQRDRPGRIVIGSRTPCGTERRNRQAGRYKLPAVEHDRPACSRTTAPCLPAHRGSFLLYSITSSARATSADGLETPKALAVLRLIAISNFVG